jgi:transposase-like protein
LDLKTIYSAANAEMAEENLKMFRNRWDKNIQRLLIRGNITGRESFPF